MEQTLNEILELLKKMNAEGNGVCSACGHCEKCGRGRYWVNPIPSYPYTFPTYPYITWGGTSGTITNVPTSTTITGITGWNSAGPITSN